MLELKDVTKRYGSEWAVRGVCLSLGEGRLAALLGPNGSGKTTLMKMVAGLVRPTSGEILFDGVPVGVSTKRHIAYMPTEAYFYGYMTALDAGKYYRDFFRDFSMERYQNMLQEEKLDSALKIRAMSSGMMAKLKLALAFSRDSRLVMLDEPLNGIDILARERTLRLIEQNHVPTRAMIVSSHLVDELEGMIDDAIFVKDGEVVLVGDAKELCARRGKSIVEIYREIYGEGGDGRNA